jgi:hypothetical protein
LCGFALPTFSPLFSGEFVNATLIAVAAAACGLGGCRGGLSGVTSSRAVGSPFWFCSGTVTGRSSWIYRPSSICPLYNVPGGSVASISRIARASPVVGLAKPTC